MSLQEAAKLGDLIREARRRKGMTLRDLDKLTGISSNYIYQLERPKRAISPSAEIVGRIADALELDLDELFLKAGWRTRAAAEDIFAHYGGEELRGLLRKLTPEEFDHMVDWMRRTVANR